MIDILFDVSHHNGPSLDFAQAHAAGFVGVFHKASQGVGGADPMYGKNRVKATAAGLMWGAYHFGTGGDGSAQADHFLDAVGDRTGALLVLDLEPNPQGATMKLDEARDFVSHVHDKTGIWPGLYSGSYLHEQLGDKKDPVLGNCWLWLARYGYAPVVPANWPTWTMWQWTDGAAGKNPQPVPGIGHCDRNRFNGTIDQLKKLWGAA